MRKYLMYLILYSFGGFILERIVNLIAYGKYLDNSVLYGPWQPLYGAGILMAIIINDKYIKKMDGGFLKKNILLLITAIITTGISEAVTGFGYEYLTGTQLWDYREFFPCTLPYICIIPTSLFGLLSYLVIKFAHPFAKVLISLTPKLVKRIITLVFVVDIVVTYFTKLV